MEINFKDFKDRVEKSLAGKAYNRLEEIYKEFSSNIFSEENEEDFEEYPNRGEEVQGPGGEFLVDLEFKESDTKLKNFRVVAINKEDALSRLNNMFGKKSFKVTKIELEPNYDYKKTDKMLGRVVKESEQLDEVSKETLKSFITKTHAKRKAAKEFVYGTKGTVDAEQRIKDKDYDRSKEEGEVYKKNPDKLVTDYKNLRDSKKYGEADALLKHHGHHLELNHLIHLSRHLGYEGNAPRNEKIINNLYNKKILESLKESEQLDETLSLKNSIKTWIDDFISSDDPRFEGKSKEERRQMAIAAYMSKKNDLKESKKEVKKAGRKLKGIMTDPSYNATDPKNTSSFKASEPVSEEAGSHVAGDILNKILKKKNGN